MGIPTDVIRLYIPESCKKFIAHATITNIIIPTGIVFCAHFSYVKQSIFKFFTDRISNRNGIIDECIPSVN